MSKQTEEKNYRMYDRFMGNTYRINETEIRESIKKALLGSGKNLAGEELQQEVSAIVDDLGKGGVFKTSIYYFTKAL